ncbi:MAG: alpha/beta hydrolase [Bacteroidales bacterium]|nr:alpha/beta hydrolase [Bacteroidales bacterium]
MAFLKKILSGFLFVFLANFVYTQNKPENFCESLPAWDKIVIKNEEIPAGIPKMLIITNRPYISGKGIKEFFPNDLANFRKVSYLIAACDGANWLLYFVSSFEEGMNEINDGSDILLFIEGHGKTLPMTLNRAKQVQSRYHVSMVVFDWPSRHSNFNLSLSRVRRCGDNFYNLLLQIREYRKQSMTENLHFSILAHSLGNYFLSNLVVCGDAQYLKDVFIDNMIMNAAAIRTREHGDVLSQLDFQKRIYITFNKYDWILRGAHMLTAGKMLGNVPMQPLVKNACYLDFTGIVGKEHSYYYGKHSFEHEMPAFFYFYNTALHGEEVNLLNKMLFLSDNTLNVYKVKLYDSSHYKPGNGNKESK